MAVVETGSVYAVLEMPESASQEDLKKAYRKRARATHPDSGGTAAQFDAVQKAWDQVSTPQKRAHYDLRQTARAHSTRSTTSSPPSAHDFRHSPDFMAAMAYMRSQQARKQREADDLRYMHYMDEEAARQMRYQDFRTESTRPGYYAKWGIFSISDEGIEIAIPKYFGVVVNVMALVLLNVIVLRTFGDLGDFPMPSLWVGFPVAMVISGVASFIMRKVPFTKRVLFSMVPVMSVIGIIGAIFGASLILQDLGTFS